MHFFSLFICVIYSSVYNFVATLGISKFKQHCINRRVAVPTYINRQNVSFFRRRIFNENCQFRQHLFNNKDWPVLCLVKMFTGDGSVSFRNTWYYRKRMWFKIYKYFLNRIVDMKVEPRLRIRPPFWLRLRLLLQTKKGFFF